MSNHTNNQRYTDERLKRLVADAYAGTPEPDPRRLAALEARLLADLPGARRRSWRWGGLLLLGLAGAAAAWWNAPVWWPAIEALFQPAAPITAPASPAAPAPARMESTVQPQAQPAAPNPNATARPKRPSATYRREEY